MSHRINRFLQHNWKHNKLAMKHQIVMLGIDFFDLIFASKLKNYFIHFSRVNNLYQQIATERDREERGLTDKKAIGVDVMGAKPEKQRTKNTIYVSGNKITEEFLKEQFSIFGNIVNVSMEIEKGYFRFKFKR